MRPISSWWRPCSRPTPPVPLAANRPLASLGTLGAPWPTDHGRRRPSRGVSSCAAAAVVPARVVARPVPHDSRPWRRLMRARPRDAPPRQPTRGWSAAALPARGTGLATVSQVVARPSCAVCAAGGCLRALHRQAWAATTGRGGKASAPAPSWSLANGVAPLMCLQSERLQPWPRGFQPLPTSRWSPGTAQTPRPQAVGKARQTPRRSPTACLCSRMWRRPSKRAFMGLIARLTSAITGHTTSPPPRMPTA
jgi:hypothetical protein